MLGSPLPPGGDLFQRKLVDKQQMWAAKQGGPSQVGFRDSWQVARKAGPPAARARTWARSQEKRSSTPLGIRSPALTLDKDNKPS